MSLTATGAPDAIAAPLQPIGQRWKLAADGGALPGWPFMVEPRETSASTIREDVDDSVSHRSAQHHARWHDRRVAIGRSGFCPTTACTRCRGASRCASTAGLAVDRPPGGQRRRRQTRAGRRAAASGRGRQTADRPAQTAARLQYRSLRQRHRQCALAAPRRQGHVVRRHPLRQQGHRRRQEGRQDRTQDHRARSLPPERSRLSQRHALHRRAVADFQDRQCRSQSRQGEHADGDL